MKRPSVLVFSGADPSSGAGMQADIQAISGLGAHPLSVITTLTVQDNDRVFSTHPVSTDLLQQQAQALIEKIQVSVIKIGIVGNRENAEMIGDIVQILRYMQPDLQVVLDPVLASGNGNTLGAGDAVKAITPLISLATVITPNLSEAQLLCDGERRAETQAAMLIGLGCPHVLIKGGHGTGKKVINRLFSESDARSWSWPRLPNAFHGSGCTLASAIAALLAHGKSVVDAIDIAQAYAHQTLEYSYEVADGQRIPNRSRPFFMAGR
jgi:hydroxymethylpyrimidine/phosphomethylpyrimidine kinase